MQLAQGWAIALGYLSGLPIDIIEIGRIFKIWQT